MAGKKERNVWQFGDFQTPLGLARAVCAVLTRRGISPGAVVEPTCGQGAFLEAAVAHFPAARHVLGLEINAAYVQEARMRLGRAARVDQGDFFTLDWDAVLSDDPGPWLVLGNPPWVTNAELGLLQSANLPAKSNFQGHKGLDALTGKANFDISEWMLLRQLEWLRGRSGWIAMLVKTAVARKLLRQAWRRGDPVGRAAIYKIDAMQHFGAAVEACLFVLPIAVGDDSQDCDVFASLEASAPESTIGFHDQFLVANVDSYLRHRDLIATNTHYVWRSGVKHDCSKVMELSKGGDGLLTNGLGECVDLETDIVFPLLKSSDVAKGRSRADRVMIVTQKEIGEDTATLAGTVPKTWRYLMDHGDRLDARGSVIYRGKPRFSVFGVGAYTFAPWKVAISGFYKSFNFMKVGPMNGKPVMLDDTLYFLPCQHESEADFIMTLVQSQPFTELLGAMVFNDEKRPITAELLKRVSLERVAGKLGMSKAYDAITRQHQPAPPRRRITTVQP
ncbi:Modification methylase [Sodalis praecaptivus]|uniref:site-specific DNA-methyltransferase (adenine-specific) n=1 Tax=Sodalis praecaptivus TaxID=1239307 RepID=W0I2Z2_9GAMM|nr:class I SAM-dependent methyltransferase [Sodalis praecaptivus]AHF78808.1 Modification methylase [Sodalis praecaptivus]